MIMIMKTCNHFFLPVSMLIIDWKNDIPFFLQGKIFEFVAERLLFKSRITYSKSRIIFSSTEVTQAFTSCEGLASSLEWMYLISNILSIEHFVKRFFKLLLLQGAVLLKIDFLSREKVR